jgi:hypothetical protein
MFDAACVTESAEPHVVLEAARTLVAAAARPVRHVMVWLAEQPGLDLAALSAALAPLGVPVTGAVFPTLIDGTTLRMRGAFVFAFERPTRRLVVHELFAARELHAARLRRELGGHRGPRTLLALVDGRAAGAASQLVDALQPPFLAPEVTICGGGAGYWVVGHGPCLFTEDEVLPDGGAVLLEADTRATVAIAHGWIELAGPFVASRCRDTTVLELDWRPAIDVYRETIARATGRPLDELHFPSVCKLFPLGLLRRRDPSVIRDPVVVTDDGGLMTLGEVQPQALVAILEAVPPALLDAAEEAARAVAAGSPRQALAFDCVTRVDSLGARYPEELQRIAAGLGPGSRWYGALSLGELASRADRLVDWYNKSLVIAGH